MLFLFLAVGVTHMTLSSFRIAHYNVYKTTAMSVAQGYMEQIKSLDNETIARMATHQIDPPVTVDQVLPTRSVSLMMMGGNADEIDDWLVANTVDPSNLSDTLQVINHKEIIVDYDQNTGEFKVMDMWIDVEIFRMTNVSGNTFLIDVQYIFSLPNLRGGTRLTRSAYVRTGSTQYSTASRSIVHKPGVNDGRLQLVTTLLNFETL